ncbi:MAG: beta-lactamase family protein [Saprospiraceae bacterium]|nr:beta-lactamase family protein [Saprospiraceae bacterium]
MTKVFFIFIGLLFFFTYCGVSQSENLESEINKLIYYDTEISYKKTPGFLVGIIDGDSTYIFSFGKKTNNSAIKISDGDVFEIGSISKIYTASLISILVKQELMDYDEPFNTYLPEEFRNPRLAHVTLNDLITHQSGLPKRPSFFGKKEKDPHNPYEFYSQEDLLKFYRDYIPDGSGFIYSHTNYALLEIALEYIAGKNFGDLLSEYIFMPLSMHNSFVEFPEKRSNLITEGHSRAGKLTTPWNFSSFKGSEGVKSSMSDMIKFIKANLNLSETKLDAIFNQNFTPSAQTTFNEKLYIAKGWHSLELKNYPIISHTGKTSGHTSSVAMVRETKTAVIILANSAVGTEDLGIQILRMINFNWKRKV